MRSWKWWIASSPSKIRRRVYASIDISTIRTFINDHVTRRLATARKSRGMFEALERSEEWDEDTDLSMGATGKWSYLLSTAL